MTKPLIGITVNADLNPGDSLTGGSLKLNANYPFAIAEAGGIPVLLAPSANPDDLADLLDGLLVPGGDDIDPAEFNQEQHEKTVLVSRGRYDFEKALFSAIQDRQPNMPYLGICYGCQFLAVQSGGSLIQHLDDDLCHTGGTPQQYSLADGSRLGSVMGGAAKGLSYHHQAVGDPGKGLDVVSRHEDGTIEAIEAPDHPFRIGVQWHPERTRDQQDSLALFRAFVQAAAEFKAAKGR